MYEITLFGDTKAIRPTDGSVLAFDTSIGTMEAVVIKTKFEL